jgi:hypothetical protein
MAELRKYESTESLKIERCFFSSSAIVSTAMPLLMMASRV